ncbi:MULTISPECIES: hypothetical protein [unclassified Clostridium]|uniref:hypothetical protein n=1 Tax=unclassified Clostridium TaxID=2614128 RepID=UPI000E4C3F7E|nr:MULTISPECIES: hypothetical protein [unclassified Clostridium]RGG37356.1 hypothetical protein DWY07_01545 [Clostridium sp. AF23-6LB]RHP92793.1 hypothetical protein DXA07_08440 [Clostridium sp. AM54-37XD]RHP95882.1 hypothetical protein DXA00_08400 [Clostridium sp. AM54-14XD]
MRKQIRRRGTAWLMFGTMMMAAVFTGCGKKDIDYDIDESGGKKDSGSIQDKYDIPKSYDDSIAVGDSGLSEITLKVDEISVPDTSIMYTEKLTKNDTAGEALKKIAEAIFDKSKGIYAYDENNQTKADIEEQIASYEQLKKELGTDAERIKEINDTLTELQDELEKAPEDYPAAGDYSATKYLGTCGQYEFVLRTPDDMILSYDLSLKEDAMVYRPADGTEDGTEMIDHGGYVSLNDSIKYGSEGAEEALNDKNQCKYSEEEALEIAEEFLKKIDCNDMTLGESSALAWTYDDALSTLIERDIDGYYFTFDRMIKDQSLGEGLQALNVDNMVQQEAGVDIPTDYCKIAVDDNGVIGAVWTNNLSVEGEAEETELLSFKELMKRADSSVSEYYAKYNTQYKSIEFNRMQLTYCLKPGAQVGEFEYVPAWIISQVEVYEFDEVTYEDPQQMVVLDATDGSYIDILEVSKALGTCSVIQD